MVASRASSDPCQKDRPLATIDDRDINVHHVRHTDVPRDPCSGLAAHPGNCPLKWQCSRGEHASCGAGGAVVPECVQAPVATAEAWRQQQRQPEAAEKEHTKLRTGNDNAVMSGRNREGPCRMGFGL